MGASASEGRRSPHQPRSESGNSISPVLQGLPSIEGSFYTGPTRATDLSSYAGSLQVGLARLAYYGGEAMYRPIPLQQPFNRLPQVPVGEQAPRTNIAYHCALRPAGPVGPVSRYLWWSPTHRPSVSRRGFPSHTPCQAAWVLPPLLTKPRAKANIRPHRLARLRKTNLVVANSAVV